MSLINDALKKAQKQRHSGLPPLSSVPGVGGERAADFSPRGRGSSGAPTGLILGVGLGVFGLLALGIAGFLFLRSRPATPATTPERPVTTVASAPAATTATPAPATPAPSTPAPTKENVFVLPVAPTAAAPAPATKVATAPTQPAVQPNVAAPAASTPPSTPAPTPEAARPAGRLEPRAVQFIDNIRVAGIRASATDSKVLMNDRVYRVGDVVEHEMGVRLVGITTSSLTFEDDRGGRYTRNF